MPTEELLGGHREFKTRFEDEQEAFVKLAEEGQSPKVFWIDCSDSRVIPEQVMGATPGELFVMRNVANIVPPFGTGDTCVGAAIEAGQLTLHPWLYDLHTGDLLAYEDTSGAWGALSLPEEAL